MIKFKNVICQGGIVSAGAERGTVAPRVEAQILSVSACAGSDAFRFTRTGD